MIENSSCWHLSISEDQKPMGGFQGRPLLAVECNKRITTPLTLLHCYYPVGFIFGYLPLCQDYLGPFVVGKIFV